jgi:nucleoside-diphosphate-sugar epimerase
VKTPEAAYIGRDVLVTGGTGFIGSHLVRRLSGAGSRVVTLGRRPARASRVEHVRGDVADARLVSALIERRFDYVFHLAGISGQEGVEAVQSLRTNCQGLLNVLEAIRALAPATSLCFASSRLVYGRARRLPVDEEHPRDPLSIYAMHKRDGEEYCKYYAGRWGVRTVALRLANPFGPHEITGHRRYNVANWMIDDLCAGRPVSIFGSGEQLRDYVYVDDAVDAMLAAASDDTANGEVFNVGSGIGTPLVGFLRAGMLVAGSGSLHVEPWPEALLRVETGDYVASIDKMRARLGWSPSVSLMEGVTRTVAAQRRTARPRSLVPARSAALDADWREEAA